MYSFTISTKIYNISAYLFMINNSKFLKKNKRKTK